MWCSTVPIIVTLLLLVSHVVQGQEVNLTYDYDNTTPTPSDEEDVQNQLNISQTQIRPQIKLDTFTQNIINDLLQERSDLQNKLSELNKDYCDLRTHLAKLTNNAVEDSVKLLETEVGDFNGNNEDCSKFVHLIKILRTQAVLESQNHKHDIESMRMEHMQSMYRLKSENLQMTETMQTDHAQITERTRTECAQTKTDLLIEMERLKTEHSKDISKLRSEKQNLDDDISRLRKLRHEDLDLEIAKAKYEKNILQTNVELSKENHQLKLLANSLNSTNLRDNEVILELKETINNFTMENDALEMKNVECLNIVQNVTMEHGVLLKKNSECRNTILNLTTENGVLVTKNLEFTKNIKNYTTDSQNQQKKLDKCEIEIRNLKEETLKLTNETLILKGQNLNLESEISTFNTTLQKCKQKERYFLDFTIKKNWYDAKSHCEGLGMELAKIETQEEVDFLYTYLTSLTANWNHIWLGSTDAAYEEEWYWYGTDKLVDRSNICGDHTKSTNANCLTTCKEGTKLNWHSLACGNSEYFLCESK